MKSLHLVAGMTIILTIATAGCTGQPSQQPQYAQLAPLQADATTTAPEGGPWQWYDARRMTVEGKGWTETEAFFQRLPAKAKAIVPQSVWNGSRHSAGLCVRFVARTRQIAARWELTNKSLAMPHMPATGVSGLDLYVKQDGRWQWIGVGQPTTFPANEDVLTGGIPEGFHEYLLYLPLYNGVDTVEIGLPVGAEMRQAPPRPQAQGKPICFYGTSIVHGGCASRPGMAFPAILGRRLDRPVINLGFSGSGKMELELADLIGELDVAAYILDCLPNMSPDLIAKRLEPFVERLREHRPDTPIVLVENIKYQAGAFIPAKRETYQSKNTALKKAYRNLLARKCRNLTYVPCDSLLGQDGDAAVDGTHPTDLGFHRFADALEPILRRLCDAPGTP